MLTSKWNARIYWEASTRRFWTTPRDKAGAGLGAILCETCNQIRSG